MQVRKYNGRTPRAPIGAQLDPRGFAAALAMKRGYVVLREGVVIPLQRGRGRTIAKAFIWVSFEDRHLGNLYWSTSTWNYPRRRDKTGRCVFLHREIMGQTFGDEGVVDHINGDRYDCRRENLRVVTQAQNCQNQDGRSTSTSKHRGVSRRHGRWVVMHTLNGKPRYGGTFDDEDVAAAEARAWRAIHMPFAVDD